MAAATLPPRREGKLARAERAHRPSLTEPHELVTWYSYDYRDMSSRCSHMPAVTVTSTCTGINVKTVNTERGSNLGFRIPDRLQYPVAQGQAVDVDLPFEDGDLVVIFWNQAWDYEPGDKPAAVLTRHVRPQSCDAPPSSPGGQLPTTGAPTWLLVSAGAMLLVLGAALSALFRGRRSGPFVQ
jgi:LPXTG-motif cell wall-anchored protein